MRDLDVECAIKNGAPANIVALIRALKRQRRGLERLLSKHSGEREREAVLAIRREISTWTRDLGCGWR